jgi:hypothetical protein
MYREWKIANNMKNGRGRLKKTTARLQPASQQEATARLGDAGIPRGHDDETG